STPPNTGSDASRNSPGAMCAASTTWSNCWSRSSCCYKRGMSLDPAIAARLKRNEAGLVAAVAQEKATGDVLMMAWMDDEALARTLATRKATYYSRSRQQYWVKGETSGHTQYVH